ncbi:MAG: Bug family tripartite tricarboxylate transporter substrate binding protein [Hydrogenophaga sp.]|uniref:Bug family tripartite tricarboxylate transporter substrate binding protein n=1 Tax=Hydrogenophaga sp. TaxID=1904254 RepID=UPI0040365211
MRRIIFNSLVFPLAMLLSYGMAIAQGYPMKPVTMIVSFPPGGDTDAIARIVSERLSLRLGQPVIIENKPGAGGTIGYSYASRAPADGHTLLFAPNSFPMAPFVFRATGANSYHPLNSFDPVIKIAEQPMLLVANAASGIKSIDGMVQAARSGKTISYASPGPGSPMHIVAEMLNRSANIKISHVPYRGTAPAVSDVVAGHVETAWVTLGAVSQYIKQGSVIPLAISDARRSALIPEIPTLAELGYKDVIVGAWYGVFAPKGTPADILNLLNKHLNEIIKEPAVAAKISSLGALPLGGRAEALTETNLSDYTLIGKVVRDLKITAE